MKLTSLFLILAIAYLALHLFAWGGNGFAVKGMPQKNQYGVVMPAVRPMYL